MFKTILVWLMGAARPLFAADRVDVVASIPAELHKPIRFPTAAAVNARPEAIRFLDAIQQKPAQNVFKTYGWTLCRP